jgi:sugar lactone lactonase YvrE
MAFALHRAKRGIQMPSIKNWLSIWILGYLTCLGCTHQEIHHGQYSLSPLQSAPLKTLVNFHGAQVTGVTVTDTGRLFANFPRWREGIPFSVVEVAQNGTFRPYPDESWNRWDGHPRINRFTCVQSVLAHGDELYVLDPSSPNLAGVIGSAKLFVFDLKTNQLKRTYEFDHNVAPQKSYLNDLRIDNSNDKIYITDSGLGAIVVLSIKSGKARRLLSNHPSTKAENITLQIDGKAFLRNGKPPRIHSDGIALNAKEGYLYYHALTGYHLYRVPTQALVAAFQDPLEEASLESKIEDLGKTPAPDGMIFDRAGNLYFADLENNSVVYRTPSGEIRTLAQDSRIRWADTFTIDSQNHLIFTNSRIHEVPAAGSIKDTDFPIYSLPIE